MFRNQPQKLLRLAVAVFAFIFGVDTYANIVTVPGSLASEVLSESYPTAFSPNEINVEDFHLQWNGEPIVDVQVKLLPRTLQWVRVHDVLVLPRARLAVHIKGLESGQVMNAGFTQSIFVKDGQGSAEIPVALISGEKNPIQIAMSRNGKLVRGELHLSFRPRQDFDDSSGRVFVDTSCSPYQFQVDSRGKLANDWVYIGCRRVRVRGEGFRTSSLEVFVYWDNVGQQIEVDGFQTASTIGSMWALRLWSEPGHLTLRAGTHEIKMEYKVPKNLYNNSISLGLGPYSFGFRGNGEVVEKVVAMPTLYASHFISDSMRIVEFGAITIEPHLYSDFGLYLHFEQFRFLDSRLSINLLLGGHALGFKSRDQYYLITALPQGFEVVFTDAFAKGKNLTLGAFIYPPINGNAYYNGWIRWGSSVFFEVNYIAWQAAPDNISFNSSSLGLTLGVPLLRFW